MPDEPSATAAQAGPGGGPAKPARPPRNAPPLALFGLSPRMTKLFVVGSAVLAGAALVAAIIHFADQMTASLTEGPPKLAREFEDKVNNYSIRPPATWVIEDRHDGANIYIKGPKEKGFPPLIIVSLEVKPGGIESYLREHKGRIGYLDKTVKWLSEEPDFIDGCSNTVRLEYECNTVLNDESQVRVHALQYIMEDKPRFYRVTCFVSTELYEKYLPIFEASARTFKRTPIPKAAPQLVP